MRIFRFELLKTVFFDKGMIVLVLCLVMEALLLILIPEQIDSRIKISRKQYDKLLREYEGETSAEKEDEILQRKADVVEILNAYDSKLKEWNSGKITEEEWQEFSDQYRDAVLIQNALEIFAEKAEAFSMQQAEKQSWYFYDYGWNTVFLILKFPNIFLLFFVLYISVRCYQYEDENGMTSLIGSSKCGWPNVFCIKFFIVILSAIVSTLLFLGEEYLVFEIRGFLTNASLPMGSIPCFYECPSELSLAEAFRTVAAIRVFGTVLVSIAAFSIGILIKRYLYSIAVMAIVLATPFVFRTALGKGLLYTWTGWISGVDFLRLIYSYNQIDILIGAETVSALSIVLMILSINKYRKSSYH